MTTLTDLQLALALLSEDKRVIAYRPSFAHKLNSVTAAALLQQVFYRWREVRRPFYKFKIPCKHKLYQAGDSWTEEMAFTRHEFDHALGLIGFKTQGTNRVGDDPAALVYYWTDMSRLTWYEINLGAFSQFLVKAIEEEEQRQSVKPESGFTYSRKVALEDKDDLHIDPICDGADSNDETGSATSAEDAIPSPLTRVTAVDSLLWNETPEDQRVYCGRNFRGYKDLGFGNPIKLNKDTPEERARVIAEFRDDLVKNAALLERVVELRGKVLGCWCRTDEQPDRECHCDVLAEFASLSDADLQAHIDAAYAVAIAANDAAKQAQKEHETAVFYMVSEKFFDAPKGSDRLKVPGVGHVVRNVMLALLKYDPQIAAEEVGQFADDYFALHPGIELKSEYKIPMNLDAWRQEKAKKAATANVVAPHQVKTDQPGVFLSAQSARARDNSANKLQGVRLND